MPGRVVSSPSCRVGRQSPGPSLPVTSTGGTNSASVAAPKCNSAEPYRTAQNAIMRREIEKYPDCELLIQDAQQDNARQIAQIENFILQG